MQTYHILYRYGNVSQYRTLRYGQPEVDWMRTTHKQHYEEYEQVHRLVLELHIRQYQLYPPGLRQPYLLLCIKQEGQRDQIERSLHLRLGIG